jgi:aminoglycoside phosphotransferase (APT) family kinase protein
MASGSPAAARDGDPVDLSRLEAYLTGCEGLRDLLPVTGLERIAGGQSNLTFRLRLAGGSLILRRPPLGPLPPKAHDVLREYRVMSALQHSRVPVPRVLLAGEDPGVIGAPFILMEDLPADPVRFQLPPALQVEGGPRAAAEGAVDALVALHTTDPAAVGLDGLSKHTGYLPRQVRLWQGQLDYARVRPVPELDETSRWLETHLPPEVSRPRIVHGDYKLDNVLFAREGPVRVLGVVDWEMAALGDPLADLGWLLAFWCEDNTPPRGMSLLSRLTEDPAFPRRHELVARYAEQAGRELPDLTFYLVFSLWKMAILLEAHWARHVRGTAGGFDFSYLEAGGPLLWAYIQTVLRGG